MELCRRISGYGEGGMGGQGLKLQAVRLKSMTRAKSSANNFFIIFPPVFIWDKDFISQIEIIVNISK